MVITIRNDITSAAAERALYRNTNCVMSKRRRKKQVKQYDDDDDDDDDHHDDDHDVKDEDDKEERSRQKAKGKKKKRRSGESDDEGKEGGGGELFQLDIEFFDPKQEDFWGMKYVYTPALGECLSLSTPLRMFCAIHIRERESYVS